MYTPLPRASGPWASGVYIRQTTLAHIITYTYIYKITTIISIANVAIATQQVYVIATKCMR